jgi:uncharacterized phage protein gp47/JayE
MPDFPTFNDIFRVGRDEILLRNAKVSRDAVEREGMDANILVAAAAAVGDQVIGQLASVAAGTFLDSAKGDALDRLVFDRYGLVRKAAAASLGTVQFSTTAPAPTTFTIPVGVRLQTPDGIQFVTNEAVIFLAATVGPVSCAARSVLAGGSQNVKAGQITSIVTPITSQPTDLVVTNPFATAGGDDAEDDDSLRDRARRFFTTVRRGTLGALEEAALGVAGVRKAAAFEIVDALGRPARLVQLVVADSFTEQFIDFTTVPPRYQVQSQLLSTSVFNALADVRPAGTFVQVIVANVILQSFQLALSFNAGADVNTAALEARATIVNYVNALVPGASIVFADAIAALVNVPGLASSGNTIISPPGNVVALPTQVLRTSLGLVTAVAAQTDQPQIVTGTNPDAFILGS